MTMDEERRGHLRAILITSATTLIGVIAAIVSSIVGGSDPTTAATNTTALLVLPAAIAIQVPIYQQLFDDWGDGRDLLFVAFMTFCLWFITWGILLTTQIRSV